MNRIPGRLTAISSSKRNPAFSGSSSLKILCMRRTRAVLRTARGWQKNAQPVASRIIVLTSRLQSSLSEQFSVGFGMSFVLAQSRSVRGSFRLAVQINVPATHPVSIIHKTTNKFGCARFPLVRHVATSSSLGAKSTKKRPGPMGRGECNWTCPSRADRRRSRITKALVRQTLLPAHYTLLHSLSHTHCFRPEV